MKHYDGTQVNLIIREYIALENCGDCRTVSLKGLQEILRRNGYGLSIPAIAARLANMKIPGAPEREKELIRLSQEDEANSRNNPKRKFSNVEFHLQNDRYKKYEYEKFNRDMARNKVWDFEKEDMVDISDVDSTEKT